jgi:uncharacterized membrane protein
MFRIFSTSRADKDARHRSLAKAVSWRLTGSIDTFVLSLLITGSIKIAGSISAVEVVTKILLFYCHERVWATIPWGKSKMIASGISR